MKLTTHLHSEPRVRMGGAIPLIHLCFRGACTKTLTLLPKHNYNLRLSLCEHLHEENCRLTVRGVMRIRPIEVSLLSCDSSSLDD